MGMLSRLREAGETFVARQLQARAISFSARIPGAAGPLVEWRLEAAAEQQSGGEALCLRSHWRITLRGQRLNSWLEVRSTNAALDEGSRALVPERLDALGIRPESGKPVQSWAGGLGGMRPGFAMLTLLQLDKERLPPRARRALGARPLHLTAMLANVVEPI
jgi:hypothetical protein